MTHEHQIQFEEVHLYTLPGCYCGGRAWVEIGKNDWSITSIEMTVGATFAPLDMTNPLHAALFDDIKNRLEADSWFNDRIWDFQRANFTYRTDAEEHGTYRAAAE